MKKLTCCAALWGIAVIVLLSYIGAGVNTSAQIPEIGFGPLSGDSVYEYLVVDIEVKVTVEATKQSLDLHGQQGWLVVSVASVKGAHRYVLVRKKDSA